MKGGGPPVIRIVKKRKAHEEHHGGSWKVAYADFVTAMMAFFLVMWVVGMDQQAKDSVQAYFNDPAGFREALSRGDASAIAVGSLAEDGPSAVDLLRLRRDRERSALVTVGDKVRERLKDVDGGLDQVADLVNVSVTEEGLRIELAESERGETFFALGSSDLRPAAVQVLRAIAPELGSVNNRVVLEGHTDSTPVATDARITNWEISNDRANAARRALEEGGLNPLRVSEVRGYADRVLADPQHPEAAVNRRISILLPMSPTRPQVTRQTAPAAGVPQPSGG